MALPDAVSAAGSRTPMSVTRVMLGLLDSLGCVTRMAATDSEGYITSDAIADSISPRTVLISLSWANALTGVIQPIEEIAQICRQRGILLHVDASHIIESQDLDLKKIEADFITIDGSLLHAPQGTGALYIRKDLTLSPLIAGGSEQASLRGGAPNVAALMALAEAAKEILQNRDFFNTETSRLRRKFEKELCKSIENSFVLFANSERIPQTTTICFPGVSSDALLYRLNRRGVFATFGGNQYQTLTSILRACGAPKQSLNSSLSFSLSRYTTEEEVDQAVAIIFDTVLDLRRISENLLEVDND